MKTDEIKLNNPGEFNFELFTLNDKPLEFSLDGFEYDKYVDIVNIVEAFGGKLTDPCIPNTIVFSEPHYEPEISCVRYDVKFLGDSIAAQKLQRLSDYRIIPSDLPRSQSTNVHTKSKKICNNARRNFTRKKLRAKTWEVGDADQSSSSADDFDFEEATRQVGKSLRACRLSKIVRFEKHDGRAKTEKFQEKISDLKRQYNVQSRNVQVSERSESEVMNSRQESSREENESENLSNEESSSGSGSHIEKDGDTEWKLPLDGRVPIVIIEKLPLSTIEKISGRNENSELCMEKSDSNVEEMQIDSLTLAPEDCMKEIEKEHADSKKSDNNVVRHNQLSDGESSRESFTVRELRELEEYAKLWPMSQSSVDLTGELVCKDENAIIFEHEDDIVQMTENLELSEIPNTDVMNMSEDNKSNIGDESTKNESKDNDSCFSPGNSESSESDENTASCGKRSLRTKQNRKKRDFTDEENRRIMQFLIDRKAIARGKGRVIWAEFLANEVLKEPKPSIHALVWNFGHVLEKNYHKYTDDPVALREFEERARNREWHRKPWTKDEEQMMINYLIENNGIYGAVSARIWEQAIRNSDFLRNTHRTAIAFRNHFIRHLRHSYARYTDNPDALRQFKDVEEKRPNRGYNMKPKIHSNSTN